MASCPDAGGGACPLKAKSDGGCTEGASAQAASGTCTISISPNSGPESPCGLASCPEAAGGACPSKAKADVGCAEGATVQAVSGTCDASISNSVEAANACGLTSCPAASGGVCPLEGVEDPETAPYPLHTAVRRLDFTGLCNMLGKIMEGVGLSSGTEVDTLNDEGWTALHVACAGPSVSCTQLLLEARASANIFTKSTAQSPLHLAAHIGSFAVADLLLEAQADVHAYEADQLFDPDTTSRYKAVVIDPARHQTALHIAAAGCNIALMRKLLDAKAELDARNNCCQTALHLALTAEDDDDDIVDLCYGSGVRVHGIKSRPERNGKLGAIIGLLDESCGRFPVLVEEGPPEGVLLKAENVSPVFTDAVNFLLDARSDVNLGNHKLGLDHTMLHEAICAGNQANAERAIAHGANVNAQKAGSMMAPLHLAVRQHSNKNIEMLLAARADPSLPEASGKTAFDLAVINKVSSQALSALAI